MTEAAVDREERGDEHLRDSGADWQDVVLSLNLSYSGAIMWHHHKNTTAPYLWFDRIIWSVWYAADSLCNSHFNGQNNNVLIMTASFWYSLWPMTIFQFPVNLTVWTKWKLVFTPASVSAWANHSLQAKHSLLICLSAALTMFDPGFLSDVQLTVQAVLRLHC